MGGGGDDEALGVTADDMGNVYVTGLTQSSVFEGQEGSSYSSDVFFTRFDVNGNRYWSFRLGDISDDIGTGTAIARDGAAFVSGTTRSLSFEGQPNLRPPSMFLTRFCPIVPTPTPTMIPSGLGSCWTNLVGADPGYSRQSVAVDNAGNVYFSGETKISVLDGQINTGSSDALLIKYNSTGGREWTRLMGGDVEEVSYGVATDLGGYVYITGYTYSYSMNGQSRPGGTSDIFLIQLDSSGTTQWTRLIGGNREEAGYGVATDTAGNIYITGYTSSISFYGQTALGGLDMVLMQFDSSGILLWSRPLGGNQDDRGYGVAVDEAGNVYVIGTTDSDIFDGKLRIGSLDVFLARFDSMGNRLWTERLGGTNMDIGCGVAIDGMGRVYVTGTTYSTPFNGHAKPASGADIFLSQFDLNGVCQWTRFLGGSGYDVSRGVSVDKDDNIFVTGWTDSDYLEGYPNAGQEDAFLACFENNGIRRWTSLFGGNKNDQPFRVAADDWGQVYVSGRTWSNPFEGQANTANGNSFLTRFCALPSPTPTPSATPIPTATPSPTPISVLQASIMLGGYMNTQLRAGRPGNLFMIMVTMNPNGGSISGIDAVEVFLQEVPTGIFLNNDSMGVFSLTTAINYQFPLQGLLELSGMNLSTHEQTRLWPYLTVD